MKVPLLDLKAQYATIRDEVRPVIDEVCESQYFILGGRVTAFEEAAAEYCQTRHAIGLSSGTDALLAALITLDIGPGDAVITTPYTFFATVGSIVRTGATPVFVDIDPITYNICPEATRELLENWPARFAELTPKALMPVHLYGQCADMAPLNALAEEHGLVVIEDAAQAIGAQYPMPDGAVKRAGSMSAFGCFSFFPSKNLGAFGDGGLATTDDDALAEKLRQVRVHGMEPKYYHRFVGANFRLDALQAAVLQVKLPYLEQWHAGRRENAKHYDKAFADAPVVTPKAVYESSGATNYHIYNQYIVRVDNRDQVRGRMLEQDVGCEIYYPLPLHMQECFDGLGYGKGDFPVSEKAAEETLALPIYPELTAEMRDYVVQALLNSLA